MPDLFGKAKGMFDVITGGDILCGDTALLWKYPNTTVTSGSRLIVAPHQEAVFFKSGSGGYEILGPGEHSVETKLIPFLSKIMNLPFGGKTPYTTHIWFINKTAKHKFEWGTPAAVTLRDPKYDNVMLDIGASGILWIQIANTEQLFMELVAAKVGAADSTFTLIDLEGELKSTLKKEIKGMLQRFANELRAGEQAKRTAKLRAEAEAEERGEIYVEEGEELKSFLDMIGENEVLAEWVKKSAQEFFEQFGITITNSAAELSVKEEGEGYEYIRKYDLELSQADLDAKKKMREARADKARFDRLGTSYMQDRQLDVMQTFAGNESSMGSNIAGMGVGFGMMGVMANQMQNMAQPMMQQTMQPMMQQQVPQQPQQPQQQAPGVTCPVCNFAQSPAKFCAECGANMERKCPSCGTPAGPGKFCNECGSPMEKKCPACGTPAGPGKFCNECGEKL